MALLDGTTLEHAWKTDNVRIVILLIVTVLAAWRIWSLLGQVIHHGGRAVWIENGRLRYLAYGKSSYSSVPLETVENLSVVAGSVFRPARIAVQAKNGIEYITLFFLSPSAELIRARLAEALPLPQSA